MKPNSAFLVTVLVDEKSESDLGRRYELSPEGTTIGNVPEADILIKFESKAPCLLRLQIEDNLWYVIDVTDHSFAHKNNLVIRDGQIFDGEVITIGPFGFEFCSGSGSKVRYFEKIENFLQEDFLTGAYNRSFLYKFLELEVGRYNRKVTEARKETISIPSSRLSIIFIDADDFGQLNKLHGHHIGDEVLRELVRRIKGQLRTIDIIGKYGGEEFIAMLLDTSKEQAFAVAENIRKLITDKPFYVDGKTLPITISGGVAELEPEMDTHSFVKVADDNMRRAKRQGKNQIVK